MENQFLNSIRCCKCFQKTLIQRSLQFRCTNCGTSLKPKPRPSRMQSENQAILKLSKTIRPRKSQLKEEEKKKPLKKIRTKKKSLKDTRQSLKPKVNNKNLKEKRPIKKKKIEKHQNSPEDSVFANSPPDRLLNHNYYSDSSEEYSIDSPLLGINSVFTIQSQSPAQLNLISVNRVPQNLLRLDLSSITRASQSLFYPFPGNSAGAEYIPSSPRARNSGILDTDRMHYNLVAIRPRRSNSTIPEIIKNIPIIRVSIQSKSQCSTCTICQEELKLSELVKLLSCGHSYHERCLSPWLSVRNTCPVCRDVIC